MIPLISRSINRIGRPVALTIKRTMFSNPVPLKLNEVLHLDKLLLKPAKEIKDVWITHLNKQEGVIPSSLSAPEFEMIKARASKWPLFMIPVHRDNGFFVLVSQVQDKVALFTDLESYRANAAGATPWVVVTFYDELIKAKDLVLFRGDITGAVGNITKLEMVNAIALWKLHYQDSDNGERTNFLRNFNERPNEFDFTRYFNSCPRGAAFQQSKKKSSVILPPEFSI